MTFQQWLRFKPSERKLRLFACAAARWYWPQLTDPRSRAAVEVAERFADGLATEEERRSAMSDGLGVVAEETCTGTDIAWLCLWKDQISVTGLQHWLTNTSACPQAALIACIGGPWVKCDMPPGIHPPGNNCPRCHGSGVVPANATLCGKQHRVRRHHVSGEVIDYLPVELPCDGCQRILAWGGIQQPCERCQSRRCYSCDYRGHTTIGTIQRIAAAIYERRTWEDMPVLHDALIEAGCESEAVLEHCRIGGYPTLHIKCGAIGEKVQQHVTREHFRGCFCLDLILGRS
jgi:hypothetical protein